MAKLKSTDQLKLETLFDMGGGYVLDFSNATFQQFVRNNTGLDIYSSKYETYGESKAKRLRALWEIESDQTVGKIIIEMIEHWCTLKMLSGSDITKQEKLLSSECNKIADRLLGKKTNNHLTSAYEKSATDFLKQKFGEVSLKGLNLESGLIDVLTQRIEEIKKCLQGGGSLAVIFLCGSTLEGILLGVATRDPKRFNQAKASPQDKSTGKVLAFHQWSLNDLINVSHEIGVLGLDVKRFSHALRDFRNYIHPYEQWRTGFNPDKDTALICWQVLKAAITDLNKYKP